MRYRGNGSPPLLQRFATAAAVVAMAVVPSCTRPCPTEFVPIELPEFVFGVGHGQSSYIPYVEELGIGWMRPNMGWKTIEPEIEIPELTVEDVEADPALIVDYIETRNWTAFDTLLATMRDAGISPFAIIGHGYGSNHPMIDGRRASPDVLGRENYLGHIYLYARAVVERYDGDGVLDAPGGLVVKHWQMENEFNQAFLTALWGWREPHGLDAFGCAWGDWDFLTLLLATLHHAIKVEDPEAVTTVNFHTDIHPNLNHLLLLPSWQEAISLWRDYMEVIGIDSYPNYYRSDPVRGEILADKVAAAVELGRGRPVIVMECGYPNGPAERGYDEERQALFIREAFDAARAAGASGYFQFGVKSTGTHSVEITDEDLENLENLGQAFQEGRAGWLLAFALLNADYMLGHFLEVLKSVEPYWGVIGAEDVHRPGWYVLRDIMEELEEKQPRQSR